MKYLNALRNQWITARGWMFTTLLLAGLLIYLLQSFVQLSANMPTRLVPYNLHLMDGPVEVGASADYTDASYLTEIAIADAQLHSTWTPRNVQEQYARFQNRMTPALHAKVGNDLLARVPDLENSERTQALFVEGTETLDDTVRVNGRLRAWHGTEQIEDESVTYRVRYSFSGGVPYVAGFSLEDE